MLNVRVNYLATVTVVKTVLYLYKSSILDIISEANHAGIR